MLMWCQKMNSIDILRFKSHVRSPIFIYKILCIGH